MTAPHMANTVITAGSIRNPALFVVVVAGVVDVVVVAALKPPPVAVGVVVGGAVVGVVVVPDAVVAFDTDPELVVEDELRLGRVANDVIVAAGRVRLALAHPDCNCWRIAVSACKFAPSSTTPPYSMEHSRHLTMLVWTEAVHKQVGDVQVASVLLAELQLELHSVGYSIPCRLCNVPNKGPAAMLTAIAEIKKTFPIIMCRVVAGWNGMKR